MIIGSDSSRIHGKDHNVSDGSSSNRHVSGYERRVALLKGILKKEFETSYCDECVLDNYHRKKHKCGLKGVKSKRLNSLAAEQMWSK